MYELRTSGADSTCESRALSLPRRGNHLPAPLYTPRVQQLGAEAKSARLSPRRIDRFVRSSYMAHRALESSPSNVGGSLVRQQRSPTYVRIRQCRGLRSLTKERRRVSRGKDASDLRRRMDVRVSHVCGGDGALRDLQGGSSGGLDNLTPPRPMRHTKSSKRRTGSHASRS